MYQKQLLLPSTKTVAKHFDNVVAQIQLCSLQSLILHPFTSFLIIGVVALLLRVVDLGGFLTVDEATTWVPNSYRFLRVLQSGNYEHTPFMGHPAITTMWLGTMGVVLRRTLFEWEILTNETYQIVLALNRLPTALVTTIGILLAYALLRRILPASIALLGTCFWATDPFIIAFSRVLHMDVLMGTFATLSLLLAWIYWYQSQRWIWIILSGICMGLAFLSKIPSVVLFPIIAIVALTAYQRNQCRDLVLPNPAVTAKRGFLQQIAFSLLLWGIITFITVIALWPTFWTNPIRAYEALRYGIEGEGGSVHLMGNFFMGQQDDTPGPLFYPVALAMRTTPWTLIGLFLLPLAMQGARRKGQSAKHSEAQNMFVVYRLMAVFAGWIVLFVIAMSMFPLKFNRYLVPIFPALDILAAFGLIGGIDWLAQTSTNIQHSFQPKIERFLSLGQPILYGTIGLVALVNAIWYHPYAIVYFNQLLGGTQAGARTFLIGWGEGMDHVAEWLNKQRDITSNITVSRLDFLLNPYLKEYAQADRAKDGTLPKGAGYLVVYVRQMQWSQLPAPYNHFFGRAEPLHVVNLHGVDYAWIYQTPQPMQYPLEANFGPALQLHGYTSDTSTLRSSGILTLTMQWYARAKMTEDYMLFVHVFDEHGQRIGQIDVPLLDMHPPIGDTPVATSAWQPGRYILWVHPVLLPMGMQSGTYSVSIGIYRPNDFSRLPLDGPAQQPTVDDGPHTLFLAPITVH